MKASLTLNPSEIAKTKAAIQKQFHGLKQPVQAAMAERYHEIVLGNLGIAGLDRPYAWPPLSNRSKVGRAYIQKVGRTYATLLETGALARAIKMDKATSDHAEVYQSTDSAPYAIEVQLGNPKKNLPPRLAFPMQPDGSARPWTLGQIKAAAERAVEAKL